MRPAPGAAPASPSAARELRQDPDAAARARTRSLARASAGGTARPRGRGGRGGAALEPGARVARAGAAAALAAGHPPDGSRRGTRVAGARARWLRARSGMVGHAAGVLEGCVTTHEFRRMMQPWP